MKKLLLPMLVLTSSIGCFNLVNASIFKTTVPADNYQVSKETAEMLSLFSEAYAKIKSQYVTAVTDKELVEAAIEGMLSSLDPHSSYFNEKDFKELTQSTKGEFGGLGIEVTMESGLIRIISAIESTPAEKIGIKPGDLIVAINGDPVFGMSLTEAVNKMRGEANTRVNISISREGENELKDFEITREIIKANPVRSEIFDNVAYLRVTTFGEKTTEQLTKEFNKIKQTLNNNIHGVILDLRNNPGGLLEQAIAVTEAFIGKGEVISTKGRNKNEISKYIAKRYDITEGLPLVVLINNGSASASEIVAGAIQDHKRGIVMGTKSFGKGSVQTVFPLGNGAMKVTTARYYTPNNQAIQAQGITPDIVVEQAKIEKLIAPKIYINEAKLKRHLASDKTKEIAKIIKNEELHSKYEKDFQLARAIDLIKSLNIINHKKKNN